MASGKTTSASYRLPVSSEYHHKCISQPVKVIRETMERAAAKDKTFSLGEHRSCNVVAQENIWKEHVHNEIKCTKDWGKNWHFLLDYDYEGKPQERKRLPENQSYFTSTFPITASNHVGKWVQSPESKEMLRMEKMMLQNRKRTDLKNYDVN